MRLHYKNSVIYYWRLCGRLCALDGSTAGAWPEPLGPRAGSITFGSTVVGGVSAARLETRRPRRPAAGAGR